MILRRGPSGMYVVMQSEEQQHFWNCPYQLTCLPRELLDRCSKRQQDTAADCQRYMERVRKGDLVLMFSDGLRDNLYEHESSAW
ncbi:unnamed protein product [Effrenium voratum]|nr:unnamed protein product [Effrenium voratum]